MYDQSIMALPSKPTVDPDPIATKVARVSTLGYLVNKLVDAAWVSAIVSAGVAWLRVGTGAWICAALLLACVLLLAAGPACFRTLTAAARWARHAQRLALAWPPGLSHAWPAAQAAAASADLDERAPALVALSRQIERAVAAAARLHAGCVTLELSPRLAPTPVHAASSAA